MPNEITEALLKYDYRDRRLNKYKFILRRSKKGRILDKVYSILLSRYMEETGIAVFGTVVIMSKKYFLQLEGFYK